MLKFSELASKNIIFVTARTNSLTYVWMIITDTNNKSFLYDDNQKEMAKLIDLTRAQNIAISLKAFKDFSFKELFKQHGDGHTY